MNLIWQAELDRVLARRQRQREEALSKNQLIDERPVQTVSPEVSVAETPIPMVEPVGSFSAPVSSDSSDVSENRSTPQKSNRTRRGRPRKSKSNIELHKSIDTQGDPNNAMSGRETQSEK